MNYYWTIAGILMIIGGLMHTIIGEKNVISHLSKNKPITNYSPDHTFNLIRWFWYLGSFISFWVGAVALTIGLWDGILPNERIIAKLLASLMLGFSVLTIGIVAMLNPRDLSKLAQAGMLILVMILLWLG